MSSMEERLQRYRQEGETNKVLKKLNIPWDQMKNLFTSSSKKNLVEQEEQDEEEEEEEIVEAVDNRRLINRNSYRRSSTEEDEEIKDDEKSSEHSDKKFIITKIVAIGFLWLLGLYIFIKIEFALLYICISLLSFICLNTRTEKDENEISAYSVFNKNCASIEGTFDADQIDRQIRGGLMF